MTDLEMVRYLLGKVPSPKWNLGRVREEEMSTDHGFDPGTVKIEIYGDWAGAEFWFRNGELYDLGVSS